MKTDPGIVMSRSCLRADLYPYPSKTSTPTKGKGFLWVMVGVDEGSGLVSTLYITVLLVAIDSALHFTMIAATIPDSFQLSSSRV